MLGSKTQSAGKHTGTRHNGERLTIEMWKVPSLTVGGYTKRDAIVGHFGLEDADGLLSMDFFRDQPFTMDFANKTLTLESADNMRKIAAKARVIPIRLKTNGPNELAFFVKICVGKNATAEAEFDTGTGFKRLLLHPSYMDRLGTKPDAKSSGSSSYFIHSTVLPEVHYCAAPSVGSAQQPVNFKEGLIYEGLIGHGAFRDRRLTIDLPKQRMLVW